MKEWTRRICAVSNDAAHCLGDALKIGSTLAKSVIESLLTSSGLLITFSIMARGCCFGGLPPERLGVRIPRKTRKKDAIKIVLKKIFLFIKMSNEGGITNS